MKLFEINYQLFFVILSGDMLSETVDTFELFSFSWSAIKVRCYNDNSEKCTAVETTNCKPIISIHI